MKGGRNQRYDIGVSKGWSRCAGTRRRDRAERAEWGRVYGCQVELGSGVDVRGVCKHGPCLSTCWDGDRWRN